MLRPLLALMLAASALSAPAALKYKRDMLNAMDYQIVNLALNLETLELNLWNQGLTNFTAQDFSDAGFPAMFPAMLELLRDQETAHTALLLKTLSPPSFQNCTYTFPVTTPAELVSFGQIVTSVGEGAYLGALANITSAAVVEAAGEIIGNEARQNSYLRYVEGIDFFNAPDFDTPLSAEQAYSLAAPYISCPASNPAFNITQVPALNATFDNSAAKHAAGDAITVTWDPTAFYLGQDVHLRFLSGMNACDTPLNQGSANAGTGSAVLPPSINGTAFVIATNYQGGGPIPDGQNFAIGPLLVA